MSTWDDIVRESTEALPLIAAAAPPCPSWCVLPADHGLTDVGEVDVADEKAMARWHRTMTVTIAGREGESAEVYVDQMERVGIWGRIELLPVSVLLQYRGGAGFSSASTRQLAAALLNAADKVDTLT